MSDEQYRIRSEILGNLVSWHGAYCTLCGVPFQIYEDRESYGLGDNYDPYWASLQDPHALELGDEKDDVVWTSYFIALKIPKAIATDAAAESNSGASITGIGQWDWLVQRLPPAGYDIRDIRKDQKPVAQRRFLMTENQQKEWEGFEGFSAPRSIYLMHPCCWDILLQQHALIGTSTNTNFDLNELSKIFLQMSLGSAGNSYRPDWVIDYAGPERFFWIKNFDELKDEPEWHFLGRDPGMVFGFDELLANPPLQSTASTSTPIQFTDEGGDILSRLPTEILMDVLVLLPTPSVRNLQLASRKMASVPLGSRYWRSRFQYPNELCHITLPTVLQTSGQMDNRWVDWRCLCDQLLHPVGQEFAWWQNRKRIIALNRKLVKSMPHRRSDGCLKEGVDFSTL